MSRVALVALLGAALLLPAASAQSLPVGATLSFEPQSTALAVTNGTFVSRPFDLALDVQPGSCPTGGSATVTFSATVAGGNGTVSAAVNPPSVVYSLGLTAGATVASARSFGTEVSVVASTSRLVSTVTNATVSVTATPTFSGCAPMSAPTVTEQMGELRVSFEPDPAVAAASQPTEIVPGLELPLLALGLVGAVLVRRRQA